MASAAVSHGAFAAPAAAAARPLRLLTLVQKAPGLAPNQRFRHEQWAPHLERTHGINLEFSAFESDSLTELLYAPRTFGRKAALMVRDLMRRWAARERARAFDGVVILRESAMLGGAWMERWLARERIPFVIDFDDAVWHWEPGGPNGFLTLARMPKKAAAACRFARAVTVGNEYLARYARQYNRDVSIVYTSVDTDQYPLLDPLPAEPFTVVWVGSHSTLRYFESVRPALERLAQRVPTRVRVICDVAPAPFTHATLDFIPWSPAREADAIAPGHVGIMPLPDTPSTRGKCGLKALQYMAIGRPAIVSPVGINCEIVRDGQNGLWATSLDEWTAQLERLALDPALALRLGRAGRETVLARYTARHSAAAFATVSRRAFGG